MTGDTINTVHKTWTSAALCPSLPDDHEASVLQNYSAEIDSAIDDEFQQLPLTPLRRNKLRELAAARIARGGGDPTGPFHSGVVTAGFGRDDVFPRLYPFEFEAITLNRLKYGATEAVEIAPGNRAVVVPFAQKEQVDTFMTGLDPALQERMQGFWTENKNAIVGVASSIGGLSDDSRAELASALSGQYEAVLDEYSTGLWQIMHNEYIRPIIRVVAMLPKDELAAMAESLVNLTSFKRKISDQAETVGGPIDVAVISKGDGFIWIKRKHYFSPDLMSAPVRN